MTTDKNKEFKIYVFDLDENLLFANEKILLFDKKNNKEIEVLQDEYYNLIKDKENYDHIQGSIELSMINFRKSNWYLKNQIEEVFNRYLNWDSEALWPSWDYFITALNDKSPIAIITARGHSVTEFKKAFNNLIKILYDKKLITTQPKEVDIDFFPCSNSELNKRFNMEFTTPIPKKKNFFFQHFLLNTLNKINVEDYSSFSIWFSDDSRGNTLQMLKYVLENNWVLTDKKIKIKEWIKDLDIEYNFYDTHDRKKQWVKFHWKPIFEFNSKEE